MMLAQAVGGGLLTQLRFDLPRVLSTNLSAEDVQHLLAGKVSQFLSIAGLMLGLLFVAIVAINVGQIGLRIQCWQVGAGLGTRLALSLRSAALPGTR